MERFLPEHIDPYRYAEQGLSLDRHKVKIGDLERLKAMAIVDDDNVTVTLTFGVDKQGDQKVTFIKGHLETRLKLLCQRCMEPFNYEIISHFLLGIVKTLDEARDLPEQYEPAMAREDGFLALRELIEDEIILNLPIIPRHEPEECKIKLPYTDTEWEQSKVESSPFHVLASLKGIKDKRQ